MFNKIFNKNFRNLLLIHTSDGLMDRANILPVPNAIEVDYRR